MTTTTLSDLKQKELLTVQNTTVRQLNECQDELGQLRIKPRLIPWG